MNWSPFPFFRIAIFFIAGILICNFFHFSFYSVYCFTAFSGLTWFLSEFFVRDIQRKKQSTGISLLLFVLCLGMGITKIKIYDQEKSNTTSESKPFVYKGIIKEKLKFNPKPKFVVQSNLNRVEASRKVDLIISFAANDSIAHTYEIGDEILFKSLLKTVKNPKNPEAFDYAQFLNYKSIKLTGFIKSENHKIITRGNVNFFERLALQASDYSKSVIQKNIKDESVNGIVQALLIGNKTNIDQNVYKAYADTGAIHVLSVSGLHVAIFISLFVFLFDKIKQNTNTFLLIKVLCLLIIVWFYVILTGMSPSVLRAGIMVSMYLIGKNLFKGVNSYNIISLAALLMLVYNPFFLFQTSFQFSYISLLSILYFQPKISKWLTFENKILSFVWDLIAVSLAAQILMFPFTIYNFHQFPMTFALSGIVAVPIVTLIIYLGTLMIVIAPITASASYGVGYLIEQIVKLLNTIIVWMSNIPHSVIQHIWVGPLVLALLVLAIIFLIYWHEMQKKSAFYIALVIIFICVSQNTFEKIKAREQVGFTIYNTYNGDVIDIFKGINVKRFVKKEIAPQTLDMVAKNHIIKCRIKNLQETALHYHDISSKKLLLLTDTQHLSIRKDSSITDYVYVGINEDPEKVIKNLNVGMIILSPSLKPWILKKWLLLQQNKGIPIHNIKDEGAFVYRTL
jgi:competence protein ComEC